MPAKEDSSAMLGAIGGRLCIWPCNKEQAAMARSKGGGPSPKEFGLQQDCLGSHQIHCADSWRKSTRHAVC